MTIYSLDPWQFRITNEASEGSISIGANHLVTGPAIRVVSLSDSAGTRVGILIGFPIDLESSRILTDSHRFAFGLGEDVDAFAKAVIESLGGRFLFALDAAGVCRLYTDGFGQVPCVFDPVLQIAASTAYALLDTQC
jgi:hypothetical protein